MKSVMWPLGCGVLQVSLAQVINPDAPCGSQPQQLSVLLVKQLTRMEIGVSAFSKAQAPMNTYQSPAVLVATEQAG